MPWALETPPTPAPLLRSALAREVADLATRQASGAMNPAGRFGGTSQPLTVVFPSRFESLSEQDAHTLGGLRQLFEANRASLESELGVPLSLVATPPGVPGPTWLVGPTACTPELSRLNLPHSTAPVVRRLPERRILVTDAPDTAGLFESFSLLRSFAWATGDSLEARSCASMDEA